jgi:hypothetical protein
LQNVEFYNKYKDVVNIICVYILEAHFVNKDEDGNIIDGWPIGSNWHIPQHKNIDDRIELAKKYVNEFNFLIPTFVDSIENDFNNKYAAWPDRAYVIFEDKIIYVSKVNNDGSRNMMWAEEIEQLLTS